MSTATLRGEGARRVRPQLLIAFFSLLGVAAIALVDGGRTSPGTLSGVHGQLPELQGRLGCAQCHGGWFSSMASACLDCHEPIAHQLDAGTGLHGTLGSAGRRCAECHSDHNGESFALVGRHSFARAGVPDPERFDHALVGFEMGGRHLELDCSACHEQADADLLLPGQRRFLGLSQSCASCHDDPHQGAMRIGCAECHTQASFDEHLARGHGAHLPLVGAHAALDCRACHAAGSVHGLEALLSGRARPAARACLDCHASPHGASFARGNAAFARSSLETSCVACHAHEHTSFRDPRLELTPAQHAASGFPLEPPHQNLSCAQCHAPELAFEARHPGRRPQDCASCHADPHGGQFDDGPFAAQGCIACHQVHAFEPHRFDAGLHARTAFPLEHSHLAVACETCHSLPEQGGPRAFVGTSPRCDACHADAHRGFFEQRGVEERGDCARCHIPSTFADVAEGAFDHGHWTSFPILGAHEQEGCAACHARSSEAEPTGRTFGRASERFTPVPAVHVPADLGETCSACHRDPHQGRFDAPGLPVLLGERAGCVRCHGSDSFRDLPHGFDHGVWTGFALEGAHARAACSACHEPLRRPDAAGRTWGAARGTACAECHVDPHAGQFAFQGRTDCSSCHRDTNHFRRLSFDHDWDSRFPLDGSHRGLDCAACHRPTRIGDATVVRYKPLGTACTDCHGTQEGSLRRTPGGRR